MLILSRLFKLILQHMMLVNSQWCATLLLAAGAPPAGAASTAEAARRPGHKEREGATAGHVDPKNALTLAGLYEKPSCKSALNTRAKGHEAFICQRSALEDRAIRGRWRRSMRRWRV